MASNSANIATETLLDTLLPGFGLLSRLVSFYLHIDLSHYSFYIFCIAISWVFSTFVLPKLFDRLQHWFLQYAVSVEIMYQDTLYGQTMEWISKHHHLSRARRSIAGTKTNYDSAWRVEDGKDGEEGGNSQLREGSQPLTSSNTWDFWKYIRYLNRRREIKYTPDRDALHRFWYQGSIFALYRKSRRNLTFMEDIIIYATPWNQQLLRELLEEIQRESLQQQSNVINVYRGMKKDGYEWVPIASNKHRSMDSVVLDPHQKGPYEANVKDYLHPETARWYRERGFHYRRTYLFRGPPGTGKTSLCLATASSFGMDIYILSLNSMGENGLALLFQALPRRCVVLFEDIDCAGIHKRRNDVNVTQAELCEDQILPTHDDEIPVDQGPITLSSLLNELDGVSTKEGRVVIMTTNLRADLDNADLDNALLRPGRVDMEVEFKLASTFVIQNLFLDFYAPRNISGGSDDDQTAEKSVSDATENISTLSAEFARHIPADKLSHAEIQNYLLRYRNEPAFAVAGAAEWIKTAGH